jgi:hypothetical protein
MTRYIELEQPIDFTVKMREEILNLKANRTL